jgi:hypothetical protein
LEESCSCINSKNPTFEAGLMMEGIAVVAMLYIAGVIY